MKTFLIIAGTAIVTVILVVGGAKITARHWGGHHYASHHDDGPGFRRDGHRGYGHHGFGHSGFTHHGLRHGSMMGAGFACADGRLDRMEAVVENFVTFTPEQAAAWKELTAAMRDAQAWKQAACEESRADRRAAMRDDDSDDRDEDDDKVEKDDARPAPAPLTDRLARMETRLETGLAALRKVRPALESFYATLNDSQRKALDDLMGHHRFHRHAGMWR